MHDPDHRARPVSFAYGQGGWLQSSEATWRWIDNRRPTPGLCDWRSDFRLARATQSGARLSDVDDVDFCFATGRCVRDRVVAGLGHKLRWLACRGRAPGDARRLRAVRVFVRANTGRWLSISGNAKNR